MVVEWVCVCMQKSVEEKMIERAEMKLRLDQLVIQQGRLADQQKGTSSGRRRPQCHMCRLIIRRGISFVPSRCR